MRGDYEDIAPALKEYRIENDGIWISWGDGGEKRCQIICDMTQKEKDLLLKDLSMRLLHDVRIYVESDWFEEELDPYDSTLSLDLFKYFVNSPLTCPFIIKPYLRPMTDMTEEEEREINKTLEEIYDFSFKMDELLEDIRFQATFPTSTIDLLNKYHFDYRGLIPMGLALPAEKGMYNF